MSESFNNTIKKNKTPKPYKGDWCTDLCVADLTDEIKEDDVIQVCRVVDGQGTKECILVKYKGGTGGGLSAEAVKAIAQACVDAAPKPLTAEQVCEITEPKRKEIRDIFSEYQNEVSIKQLAQDQRITDLEVCVQELKNPDVDLPPSCNISCEAVAVNNPYADTIEYTMNILNEDPTHTYTIEFFSDEMGNDSLGNANPQVIQYSMNGNFCIWGRITDVTTGLTSDIDGVICKSSVCSIVDIPDTPWSGVATCSVDADCKIQLSNTVANTNGISSYSWTYMGTEISTNSSDVYDVTENKVYNFKLTVTDGLGDTECFLCSGLVDCVKVLPVCNSLTCTREDNGDITVVSDTTGATSYTWTLGAFNGNSATGSFTIPFSAVDGVAGTLTVTAANADGVCEDTCVVDAYNPCPTADDFASSCTPIEGMENCFAVSVAHSVPNVTNFCATDVSAGQIADGTLLGGSAMTSATSDCGAILDDSNPLEPEPIQMCGVQLASVITLDSGQLGVIPINAPWLINGSSIEAVFGSQKVGGNSYCRVNVLIGGITSTFPSTSIVINGATYTGASASIQTGFLPGNTLFYWDVPCSVATSFGTNQLTISGDGVSGGDIQGGTPYTADPCDTNGDLILCWDSEGEHTANITVSITGCPDVVIPITCGQPSTKVTITETGGTASVSFDFGGGAGGNQINYCGSSTQLAAPSIPNSTMTPPTGQVNGVNKIEEYRIIIVSGGDCFHTLELEGNHPANFISGDDYSINGVGFDGAIATHTATATSTTWVWTLTPAQCTALDGLCAATYETCEGGNSNTSGGTPDGKINLDPLSDNCNPCFSAPSIWFTSPTATGIILTADDGFSETYTLAQGQAGELCYHAINSNESVVITAELIDPSGNVLSDPVNFTSGPNCGVSCTKEPDGSIVVTP